MKPSRTLITITLLIIVLSVIASGVALLLQEIGEPVPFTTARGEDVLLFGHGLYRYDSLFSGANYRAQDVVTVALGVPLLIVTLLLYRRGSLRGGFLLAAVLGFFLYVYASMALMAAFNPLFLLYAALFSLSFFGMVLIFRYLENYGAVKAADQWSRGAGQGAKSPSEQALDIQQLPRRGPAVFMFAAGVVTLVVWLLPLIIALVSGSVPDRLDHNTTMVTDALDLGIITPATFLCGVLILRRRILGYIMAMPLLGLIIMLLFLISGGTISQIAAGIAFSPGEIIGPIAGFGILGVFGIIILVSIVKRIPALRGSEDNN